MMFLMSFSISDLDVTLTEGNLVGLLGSGKIYTIGFNDRTYKNGLISPYKYIIVLNIKNILK